MKRGALGLLAVMAMLFAGCGKNSVGAAKHPWSSFKVGSYVKTRMSSAMNVAGRTIEELLAATIR